MQTAVAVRLWMHAKETCTSPYRTCLDGRMWALSSSSSFENILVERRYVALIACAMRRHHYGCIHAPDKRSNVKDAWKHVQWLEILINLLGGQTRLFQAGYVLAKDSYFGMPLMTGDLESSIVVTRCG